MSPSGFSCVHLLVAAQLAAMPAGQSPAAPGSSLPEALSAPNLIILVPALVTVVALFRTSISRVFLNVYLPVLLLLPLYFHAKLPLLPPLTFTQAVTLPLGCALLLRHWRSWTLSVTDVALFVFVLSAGASHALAHDTSPAIFNIFSRTLDCLVPYLFGKLLIEQFGLRVATARRVVVLLTAVSFLSVLEYFIGINPFAFIFKPFFPNQNLVWLTQFRWGFGRVAGPYGQSELAGIMLFAGIVLSLWLILSDRGQDQRRSTGMRLPASMLVVLVLTLFTTQARGPWLGCILAVPITLLGLTRRLLRNSAILLTLCLLASLAIYVKGKTYTSASPSTDEQQTAQYRAQLIDSYVPIAQQGGAWGWGENFPVVHTQSSVDNEYLFLWLVQGWVGLVSFVVLCATTAYALASKVVRSTGKRDRFFALTLLGCFSGMLLTIGTVFLFGQPFQLFFLVAGWAQSVQTARIAHKQQRPLRFAHALA